MISFVSHYFSAVLQWVADPYGWLLVAIATAVQILIPGCRPRLTTDFKIDWGYYPLVFFASTSFGFLGFLSHW